MKYVIIHSKVNHVVMFYLLRVVSMDANCVHYDRFECILGNENYQKECDTTMKYGEDGDCDVLFIFDDYNECYNKLVSVSHIKKISDYNRYYNRYVRKLKVERINNL